MRRLLRVAALALAALIPYPAYAANSWGTDFSDLWWNPDESGWGVNVAHQGEVIFMTLFVYGQGDRATWYVGPALTDQLGPESLVFRGTIYETTGPQLGSAFNPGRVTRRAVGTATIDFLGVSEAILTYDVDGILSTKRIVRQTFRSNDLGGNYIGATIGSRTECGAASGNFARSSLFAVSHVGSAIRIESFTGGVTGCNFSGTYVQRGRMGSFAGPIACPDGTKGTITAYEIEAGDQSFVARYTALYEGGCNETGRIGGLKQ